MQTNEVSTSIANPHVTEISTSSPMGEVEDNLFGFKIMLPVRI